ncbi:MAG: hypothetical protein IKQ37_09860 [Bacteroidaceae bacterium]|nr:hypothetical protein [Bacteroidaceae bacterium]
MKKFYMTMVAMLCGVAAMAQDAVMSAEPVDVKTDGTVSTLVFKLALSDAAKTGKTPVQTASVKFVLPEGVAARWYDPDEDDYLDQVTYDMAKNSHQKMFVQGEQNPQSYVLAIMGTATLKSTTDVFATVGLKVVGEIAKGDYEISVTPDYSSGGVSVFPQEPFTVQLTVDGGTGINSINADDVNAPIYNIAGQRVSKAQKGVYIQNGKKVAVK